MDTTKIKDLIRTGIHQGQYPQFVYKYRVSDPVRNKYFNDIFAKSELMFSSPKAFNDPFDCQLQPVLYPTEAEVHAFLTRMLPKAATADIDRLVANAMKDPKKFADILEAEIQFDDKGVLCLSQEPDNIVLWSHYADNHAGVCLKFDMLQDLDFFSIPLHVIYDQSYPVYNHMTQQSDIVQKMIKTKYSDWSYEKELRIFKQAKGVYTFKKQALVEVIFGCATPQKEIDRIKQIGAINGYTHMTYKKTQKRTTNYGLDLIPA